MILMESLFLTSTIDRCAIYAADGARLCAAATHGCKCHGGQCGVHCDCLNLAPCAYDEQRRLSFIVQDMPDAAVIECFSGCGCKPSCRNRVVSRGLSTPLTVFKSQTRGWAVRARCPLICGQFVCEYAGEIISSAEAALRHRRRSGRPNYLMTVQEHTLSAQTLVTNIDPTIGGNVGRFINHSCQPNLAAVLVRAGSFVPRVAFFCKRDIPTGEELTFFYGDYARCYSGPNAETRMSAAFNAACGDSQSGDGGLRPAAGKPCLCGEAKCLGSLPCDIPAI